MASVKWFLMALVVGAIGLTGCSKEAEEAPDSTQEPAPAVAAAPPEVARVLPGQGVDAGKTGMYRDPRGGASPARGIEGGPHATSPGTPGCGGHPPSAKRRNRASGAGVWRSCRS